MIVDLPGSLAPTGQGGEAGGAPAGGRPADALPARRP